MGLNMGLTYVFALVVGLGILTVQSVLGSKDADIDGEIGADSEFSFEADGDLDGDADLNADADLDAEAEHAGQGQTGHEHSGTSGVGGFVALFLSVRFWVFASLGFGLSGTLLHYFTNVGATPTLLTAITLSLITGLMASLAFRALRRSTAAQVDNTATAVGTVGRVLLPVASESRGKIRIQLRGHMVDLIASTDGARIERGDRVVIEEVAGDVALVSRAPDELQ